ncbi:helix-turn-helix domain-containing protein [Amycolatopsis keratiniphila]|uniref:helix-turn-helix domain-containing protein n=1 Tax=Amycolatopsis keratiniphila TaxID=129921 RepID=UPI0009DEA1F3|nr:XRE family transcriptional regulator [Amycolatopsis keratiniphila]
MAATQQDVVARVRAAMTSAGMSQQRLAVAIDIDPSALSRALTCQRQFKSVEIALIAEALGVSVASLLATSSDAPEPMLVAARTQPDTDIGTGIESVIARATELVETDGLLTELGFSIRAEGYSVKFDENAPPYVQGQQMADSLREQIEIGHEDLPANLTSLADFIEKKLHIDVAFEPLTDGFDGLSVCSGNFKLALISSRISGTRQRFTLAHEIGHIIAGDSQSLHLDENIYSRKSPEEVRANAFAAAFLMPAEGLRKAASNTLIDEALVAELLGRFRVSIEALAFRLHNLQIVSAAERDRIRRMSSNRIALRSGRTADLQARNDIRRPEILLLRAINAYVEGAISIRPLARVAQVEPEALLEDLSPFRQPDTTEESEAVLAP